MSIVLKQAAQQAIEAIQDLRGYRPDIDKAIEALRTALSQQPDNTSCKSVQKRLEAQQPATGEPDVDFDLQELREIERAMDDFADCGETDVSDALLLRGVRAGFLECTHFHVANRGALQDAIDAAMLTAAPAQKGQP